MKIGIIGAGRMGCLIAANAASGGAECFLIDPWEEHIAAINSNGLTVYNNDDPPFTVPCRGFTSADQVGEIMDILVILVMGHQTRKAVEAVMCLADSSTYCLTLQNGIGNVEILDEYFPSEKTLYGVVPYGGNMIAPGVVKTLTDKDAHSSFGCSGREEPDSFMESFAALMRSRGLAFYTESKSAVDSYVWYKLAKNCSGNAICAVTRLPLGPYTNCPEARPIETSLFMEVATVAKAKGIDISGWNWRTGGKMPVESRMYGHLPSTAQDVVAKRRTEIDFLNGAVAVEGDRLGVPTPYNHMITEIIKVMEANYDKML